MVIPLVANQDLTPMLMQSAYSVLSIENILTFYKFYWHGATCCFDDKLFTSTYQRQDRDYEHCKAIPSLVSLLHYSYCH